MRCMYMIVSPILRVDRWEHFLYDVCDGWRSHQEYKAQEQAERRSFDYRLFVLIAKRSEQHQRNERNQCSQQSNAYTLAE